MLEQGLLELDAPRDLPVIISGMASSTIGWHELPYARTPFACDGSDVVWKQVEERVILVSGLRTEEKALRGTADAAVDRAILVEGSHRGRLDDALARHLLPLLEHPAVIDRYRLVYQLRKD